MPEISLPLPHFRLTLFIFISCCFSVPPTNPWELSTLQAGGPPQGPPKQSSLLSRSSKAPKCTWAMSHCCPLPSPGLCGARGDVVSVWGGPVLPRHQESTSHVPRYPRLAGTIVVYF